MAPPREMTLRLPRFLTDVEVQRVLPSETDLAECERVTFDWSDVSFFDDFTLLKMLLIQRRWRQSAKRVLNAGFAQSHISPSNQAVLRQLWAVGLPEVIVSGVLSEPECEKGVIKDEALLLSTDPFRGLEEPSTSTAVVPMLSSHEVSHFAPGSREEQQLDSFIRLCLRPSQGPDWAWDLVDSRVFRHLIVEQVRRNVQEHAPAEGDSANGMPDGYRAVGLAVVRVWTPSSMAREWHLNERDCVAVHEAWRSSPVSVVLPQIPGDGAVLQVTVVDDGVGIPSSLAGRYRSLQAHQEELFSKPRYSDAQFTARFSEPSTWSDPKATLIAFATDHLGTSKVDRPDEVKGLEYLRIDATMNRGGAARIESDGSAVIGFSRPHDYGFEAVPALDWCPWGGTGISAAIPMSAIRVGPEGPHKASRHRGRSGAPRVGSSERVLVRDLLQLVTPAALAGASVTGAYKQCARTVMARLALPEPEDLFGELRQNLLVVVDWGELPESKSVYHALLAELADLLRETDSRSVRPFIYANLPKGLCGLLATAIGRYSLGPRSTPVCAFAAEDQEPYWLGLDVKDTITAPADARSLTPRRKLTDRKETRLEAYVRECLTQALEGQLQIATAGVSRRFGADEHRDESGQQAQLNTHLMHVAGRCSLFREVSASAVDGEVRYVGRFRRVFSMDQIQAAVRDLFLDRFADVLTRPPVCFTPKESTEGIRLPHGGRIVSRYFRSDALISSPIAPEMTTELITLAVDVAHRAPRGRLDWVVSCTSPLHWFVHRIVDGLTESGIACSHHVFASYETIPTTVNELQMRQGEAVLAFTDVIATGGTAYRLADTLTTHFGVTMVGLISLADIRTDHDRQHGPNLESAYSGNLLCLYSRPEPERKDLKEAYYVHPETVVPKRSSEVDAKEDFFDRNYTGSGPLLEYHSYFRDPKRTLDLLVALQAIQFGHYQHGSHHSEVFVDVEKLLGFRDYRNLLVTAISRYILTNDIRLVVYPSHSSVYIVADELKLVLTRHQPVIEFVMACRTSSGPRGTSYTLTRFTPHSDEEWRRYATGGVLIIDDAVCTGATIQSIVAEFARVDRNYYAARTPAPAAEGSERFRVHVVTFLNRLSRVSGDFWSGLPGVVDGRVQFSALLRLPIPAESEDSCRLCRLARRLEHLLHSSEYSLYSKEFLGWWFARCAVTLSHERRHKPTRLAPRFSPTETVRLAGYLSAMERHGYHLVVRDLHAADSAETAAVRVHVRGRAVLLHGLGSARKGQDDAVELRIEIDALFDIALSEGDEDVRRLLVLELLQTVNLRYFQRRRGVGEVAQVVECMIRRCAALFADRLVVGAVACVVDSCIRGLEASERNVMREALRRSIRAALPEGIEAAGWQVMVDWLRDYLDERGPGLDSVGAAVLKLADCARMGGRNHFYGRSELDALVGQMSQKAIELRANAAPERIARIRAATELFTELVRASRVLRSASAVPEAALKSVQDGTEAAVDSIRRLCEGLQNSETENPVEDYQRVGQLYLGCYTKWFGGRGDAQPMATAIISRFTPRLAATLAEALRSFEFTKRRADSVELQTVIPPGSEELRVVVAPQVLMTAVHQLLDNVERYAVAEHVRVVCEVHPALEPTLPRLAESAPRRQRVVIVVGNSDEAPCNLSQIRLRGLSDVQMQLEEYGGSLEIAPGTEWAFAVKIHLVVWREERHEAVLR